MHGILLSQLEIHVLEKIATVSVKKKGIKDHGSLIKANRSSVAVLFKISFCDTDDGMLIK